jgi:hypothetical protein
MRYDGGGFECQPCVLADIKVRAQSATRWTRNDVTQPHDEVGQDYILPKHHANENFLREDRIIT